MQVLWQEPVSPRQLNPAVPRDLETIALKCLEKQPLRRYATAQALAEDLRRFLAGDPILARPLSEVEWVCRWCGRNRILAAAAGAVALALAAVLVVSVAFAVARTRAASRLREEQRQTEAALQQARDEHEQAILTLADVQTAFGLTADERGDPAQAALWFANAARLAHDDPWRRHDNRVRVRSWLRGCYLPIRSIRNDGQFQGMAMHPRDRSLAMIDAAGNCVVWDVPGQKRRVLSSGLSGASVLAWSPAGTRLAVGTEKGTVEWFALPEGVRIGRVLHRGKIASLAFSPDGRYLAVAGDAARVWESETQKPVTGDLVHPQPVVAMVFNSRGDRLATACADGKARVFAVPDGGAGSPLFAPVAHVPWNGADAPNEQPVAPIFIREDRELITVSKGPDGGLTWSDAADGSTLAVTPEPSIQMVHASADRRYVVTGAHQKARVYDAATRTPVGRPLSHDADVLLAAFDPQGQRLATASADNTVRLWSVPEGLSLGPPLPHQAAVLLVGFLPDNAAGANVAGTLRVPTANSERLPAGVDLLTIQAGGLIRAWQPPRADPRNWRVSLDVASRISLSADGQYLIPTGAGGRAERLRATQMLETATGRPAGPVLEPSGAILDAAISPGGRNVCLLAAAGAGPPGCVEFWDWREARRVGRPLTTPSEPRSVAYCPDGRQLAVLCAQGQLLLIDAGTGQVTDTLTYGPGLHGHEAISGGLSQFSFHENGTVPFGCAASNGSVRFSPDGRSLAAWGPDDAVHIWDVAIAMPRDAPLQHDDRCLDVQFSRDGRLVATTSRDNTARVWDLATGQRLADPILHPGDVLAASFSLDAERIATARRNGAWRLYDWRKGGLLRPPFPSESETVAVAFTPDGEWIVTLGTAGVRVWECHTVKPVMPAMRLDGEPLCLAITPDGRYAVASDLSGSLRGIHLGDLAAHDDLSDEDRFLLTEIVSGQRIHEHSGVVRLSAREWWERWRRFSARRPGFDLFAPDSSGSNNQDR